MKGVAHDSLTPALQKDESAWIISVPKKSVK
jgi:hypothetical protein